MKSLYHVLVISYCISKPYFVPKINARTPSQKHLSSSSRAHSVLCAARQKLSSLWIDCFQSILALLCHRTVLGLSPYFKQWHRCFYEERKKQSQTPASLPMSSLQIEKSLTKDLKNKQQGLKMIVQFKKTDLWHLWKCVVQKHYCYHSCIICKDDFKFPLMSS